MPNATNSIGERIAAVMDVLSMKQKDFAERIGVTPAAISAMCKGKNGASATTIKAICGTFDVNESWLLTGEGEMFSKKSAYDDIADFVADLSKKEPDDFQVRLISALARLSPEKWELVEEIFDDIANKRA